MAEITNVSKLIINYLTEEQYETAKASGLINANELYIESAQRLLGVAHPTNHPPSIITQDESNRFVTDAEKATWNNKVDKVAGKGLSTEDYTTAEKTKLAGVAENANNYVHPTTAGNKHIPTGGAPGQILRYSASGTAVWGEDSDTITTINGKTGAITKADIVALGIPAQDTVVDISGKVDKVAGKGLSTEDYTSAEKTKLAGIASGAEVNVQSDWNATEGDAKILHKPTTMPPTAHKSSHATGGGDALTAGDIGAASCTSGTATLAVASWVGTAAPYTYAVNISGLTADDVLDVKAVEGMDKAAADLIKDAWGKAIGHFLPQTSAGKLTFYASEKPAVAIPIYWRLIK